MQEIRTARFELTSAQVFVGAFVLACAAAAVLIGSFPLAASIGTSFVFAGVHNVMEFRYFAARMPLRWGKSKVFQSVGIGGVAILAIAYLTLYFASGNWLWSESSWAIFAATWNTAFILWVGLLFYLRGKQRPKSDWALAFPAAFLLAALAWIVPQYWSLALVYIHPLIAMWFLERQIRRTKPEWLGAFPVCLASIPVFLVAIWVAFSSRPNLSEETNLFWRISQHAGSQILPGISSHILVAGTASLNIFAVPPIALLSSMSVFGERLTGNEWAGIALIGAGLAILAAIAWRASRRGAGTEIAPAPLEGG